MSWIIRIDPVATVTTNSPNVLVHLRRTMDKIVERQVARDSEEGIKSRISRYSDSSSDGSLGHTEDGAT